MSRRAPAAEPLPEDQDPGPGHFEIVRHGAIEPDALNPRKFIDPAGLEDLAQSMKNGVGIIEPIIVRPAPEGGGRLRIIAGERRWRAAALVPLDTVPVLVKALNDRQVLDFMMVENEQREDITPLEKGNVYRQSIGFGRTEADVAARIGRPIRYVRDCMRLGDLVDSAQALLLNHTIPIGHAIELSRLLPEQQRAAIDPQAIALFTPDHSLLTTLEYQAEEAAKKKNPWAGLKVRSLGEFKSWINERCRLQPQAAVAQDVFPEAAQAFEQEAKVIKITRSHHVHEDAKEDGERTYGPQSWKRADGLEKSKTCEHAQPAIVVVGPGRGEVFQVCITKTCRPHWAAEQRRRAQIARGGTAGDKAREAREARERAEQARKEARRAHVQAAKPAILEAIKAKLATLNGAQLLELIGRSFPRSAGARAAFPGKAIEQGLRACLFADVEQGFANNWWAEENVARKAKPIGVKVGPLIEKAAKAATKKASTPKGRAKR